MTFSAMAKQQKQNTLPLRNPQTTCVFSLNVKNLSAEMVECFCKRHKTDAASLHPNCNAFNACPWALSNMGAASS